MRGTAKKQSRLGPSAPSLLPSGRRGQRTDGRTGAAEQRRGRRIPGRRQTRRSRQAGRDNSDRVRAVLLLPPHSLFEIKAQAGTRTERERERGRRRRGKVAALHWRGRGCKLVASARGPCARSTRRSSKPSPRRRRRHHLSLPPGKPPSPRRFQQPTSRPINSLQTQGSTRFEAEPSSVPACLPVIEHDLDGGGDGGRRRRGARS